MTDGRNAVVSVVFGILLAIPLLVPAAAVLYRREGRLPAFALLQLAAATIYCCALGAYTLLPTPPAREVEACVGRQLQPFAFVGDVLEHGVDSPSALLRNPALLQVVLNVALFAPLGAGVRLLLHRGLGTAAVLGLAVSLAIECTQLTGGWGVYSCAYRLFDVDDLLTNTGGAVLGAAIALLVARPRRPRAGALVAIPVSLGRRLLGLTADAVAIGALQLVLLALGAVWGAWGGGPHPDEVPEGVESLVLWGVPAVIELALVLRTGRSAGEALVLIRNEPGTGRPWLQALLGVTGYCLLGATGLLQGLFVVVTLVAVLATRDRRGLSRLASGGRIRALGRARHSR